MEFPKYGGRVVTNGEKVKTPLGVVTVGITAGGTVLVYLGNLIAGGGSVEAALKALGGLLGLPMN